MNRLIRIDWYQTNPGAIFSRNPNGIVQTSELKARLAKRVRKLDGFDPSRSIVSQLMDAMVFDKS